MGLIDHETASRSTVHHLQAAVDLGPDFAKASIVCVNCASTSSAMIMTSGNSKLKSSVLRFSCKVPKMVT